MWRRAHCFPPYHALSPAFRALNTHDLRRGLRPQPANRSWGHLPCFGTSLVAVFQTHHRIWVITLAWFNTCILCTWMLCSSTYIGVRMVFMLQWKCGGSVSVSVIVEMSMIKGFSGKTLRNSFSKENTYLVKAKFGDTSQRSRQKKPDRLPSGVLSQGRKFLNFFVISFA